MKEKSHNKKKEVKALIIRDILQRQLSGQGLRKSEIEKDMKGLGIPRPNFEFHLYSKKKHQEGLIPKKVIKSKEGNLYLNLKSLKSLTTIIDYLENDPDYGEKVRYLLDRAFKEAFYSEYGDMLINEWRLFRILIESFNIIPKGPVELGLSESELEVMAIEIYVQLLERIFSKSLPEHNPLFKSMPKEKAEAIFIKAFETVEDIDILSFLVDFAESLRGNDSLEFKIAYIIKALEISEWVWELKTKGDERYKYLGLQDVSLVFQDTDEIMDLSNTTESLIEMFMEKVIKRALNEKVQIDRNLSTKISILDLFMPEDLLHEYYKIKDEMRSLLNGTFLIHPKSSEEREALMKKREELGLLTYPFVF